MWFSPFHLPKSCFLLWIGIIGFLIRTIHCRKGWKQPNRWFTPSTRDDALNGTPWLWLQALINFLKAWRGSKCEISQVFMLGRGWKWCQRPLPPDIIGFFFEWIDQKWVYSPWRNRRRTDPIENNGNTKGKRKNRSDPVMHKGTTWKHLVRTDTSIRLYLSFAFELYGSYRMHNYLFHCLAKHLINQFFMCSVFVTSEAPEKRIKATPTSMLVATVITILDASRKGNRV